MAYANSWVVKSETSGKLYGPASSGRTAAKSCSRSSQEIAASELVVE